MSVRLDMPKEVNGGIPVYLLSAMDVAEYLEKKPLIMPAVVPVSLLKVFPSVNVMPQFSIKEHSRVKKSGDTYC